MDQVTEHQHLLGAKARAEREQAIEVSLVAIARKGDALGLKALGFTEVQIGHEQGPPLGIPGGPLGQQLEGARAPAEVCAAAQRWPITRW